MTAACMIKLYGTRGDLEKYFTSVEAADTIRAKYVMPYENNIPLWICRGLQQPIAEAWPRLKHYE